MAKRTKLTATDAVDDKNENAPDVPQDTGHGSDVSEVKIKANEKTDNLRIAIHTATSVHPVNLNGDELQLAYSLADYVTKMKPGKVINSEVGGTIQESFRKNILKVLKLDEDRFPVFMDWLIDVIRASRASNGAFHDRYVLRYSSMLKCSTDQLQLFTRMINLLVTTADIPNKRLIGKRVDISYIVNSLAHADVRNKILKYYN